MLTNPVYPQSVGTCPVCKGTKRQFYTGEARFAELCAGYSKTDHTIPCQNCGGQYMFGSPTGLVKHNNLDEPCHHEYKASNVGNCLTQYTCIHCRDSYQIDSGD